MKRSVHHHQRPSQQRLKKLAQQCAWRLLTALLFGLAAMPLMAQDPSSDEEKLKTLKTEIQQLKNWLNKAKSERQAVENALESSEQDIAEQLRKIDQLRLQLEAEKKKQRLLEQQQSQLDNRKQSQQSLLSKQLRAAYIMGQQQYIQLLLEQQNPHQLARVANYYQYYSRAKAKQIAAFKETLQELKSTEQALLESSLALIEQKKRLQAGLNQLKAQQKKRNQVLASLSQQINTEDKKLSRLQADRAHLENLLHAIETTISKLAQTHDAKPFTQLRGQLPWPTTGKLTSRYGTAMRGSQKWQGILIQAPGGTQVNAIHHGRVIFADWLRGFGLLMIIDHGQGYMSLYGRNRTLYKEPGEWVNQGEHIASVGNTGGFEVSQLYFEIRRDGQPTNPVGWLRRRG